MNPDALETGVGVMHLVAFSTPVPTHVTCLEPVIRGKSYEASVRVKGGWVRESQAAVDEIPSCNARSLLLRGHEPAEGPNTAC